MNKLRKESPTLKDLLVKLRGHLPHFRQRYQVKSLWIFGSYAHGKQKKRSDLDILVEFDDDNNPLSLLEFIALKNQLSQLLMIKVDLVEKNTLKPAIGAYILQELVPV
jgi:predicted nucleotidyltransferase